MLPILKKNIGDLKIFICTTLLIVLVWMLNPGFSGDTLIGRNDITSGLLWILRDYKKYTIDQISYIPSILGGYPLGYAVGFPWPLIMVMKVFDFDQYIATNIVFIFLQSSLAYFAFKIWLLQKIQTVDDHNKLKFFLEIFFITSVVSFCPVLGWRFSYGHLNLILGLLAIFAGLFLILSFKNKKISFFDYFLVFLVLSLALNFATFQFLVYGVYILAVVILLKVNKGIFRFFIAKENIFFFTFFILVNFFFIFPFFSYYLLGNSSRSDHIDIFSYAPLQLRHIPSFFIWENTMFDLDENKFKWHELHYSLIFSFLCFFAIRGIFKKVFISSLLLLVFFFLFQFSFAVEILNYLPFLNVFRVPQRILIILCALGSLWAIFWFLQNILWEKINRKHFLFIVFIFSFGLYLMNYMKGYINLLMIISLVLALIGVFKEKSLLLVSSLIFLSFTSVAAFFSNFLPFISVTSLKSIDTPVLNVFDNPYQRSYLGFEISEFHFNTGYALGISTLDGYFYAPKRFSELLHAIKGKKFDPTFLAWRFSEEDILLSHLFNIRSKVLLNETSFKVEPVQVSHNGLIFPSKITFEDDINEIASGLKRDWRHAFLSLDLLIKYRYLDACYLNSISVSFDKDVNFLMFKGEVKKDCLVIIPTNFSENLFFHSFNDNEATLIPVNHALTGLILKKGMVKGYLKSRYFKF